jgi:hypothetical protein
MEGGVFAQLLVIFSVHNSCVFCGFHMNALVCCTVQYLEITGFTLPLVGIGGSHESLRQKIRT